MSPEPDFTDITFIPLDELTTPQNGHECLLDRWWVVHPEKGALVFKRWSPQCNVNRALADHMIEARYHGCVTTFVPLAFVKPGPQW